MSNESPAEPDQPENETIPPVVVRKDPICGVFACVISQEADGLREWLVGSGTVVQADDDDATGLGMPGHRTLLFFKRHPQTVRNEICEYGLNAEVDSAAPLTENSYSGPVGKLLELGSPWAHEDDALTDEDDDDAFTDEDDALADSDDEYAAYGLTGDHVPELIRMALDEELYTAPRDNPVSYGPYHACWALGNLGAEEAIIPLLGLLQRADDWDNDWVNVDLPLVFAAIGPSSIAPIADFAANSDNGPQARTAAVRALGKIARKHPEARDECAARLRAQLERFSEQSQELNAFIIYELMNLRALEAASLMEQAFAADCVDEAVCGDWEDVAIDLGLKSKRERPKRPNRFTEFRDKIFEQFSLEPLPAEEQTEPDYLPYSSQVPFVAPPKVGRNDPCPCGSQKKYKKCCGREG